MTDTARTARTYTPPLTDDDRALLVRIDQSEEPLHKYDFEPSTERTARMDSREKAAHERKDLRRADDRSRLEMSLLKRGLVAAGGVPEGYSASEAVIEVTEAGHAEIARLTGERDAYLARLVKPMAERWPRLTTAAASLCAAWANMRACPDTDVAETLIALRKTQIEALAAGEAWGKALHDVHGFVDHSYRAHWPAYPGRDWAARAAAMAEIALTATGFDISPHLVDHDDHGTHSLLARELRALVDHQVAHREQALAERGTAPAPDLAAQIEAGIASLATVLDAQAGRIAAQAETAEARRLLAAAQAGRAAAQAERDEALAELERAEAEPVKEVEEVVEPAPTEPVLPQLEARAEQARTATARADTKASLLMVVPATALALAGAVLPGLDGTGTWFGWAAVGAAVAGAGILGAVIWPRTAPGPRYGAEVLLKSMMATAADPEQRLLAAAEEVSVLERLVHAKWTLVRTALVVLGGGVVLAAVAAVTG